jgi:ABC-type Fe3+-hydroxamate transport system substrate-binding protein
MIQSIANITESDASQLIDKIETGFTELQPLNSSKVVLNLIWKNPFMAAGSDTFINDMLQRCGFKNAVSETRYPKLTEKQIINLNPELILLSSEPFPFKEKHVRELQEVLPKTTIKLADGEVFSWYGSRLKYAPDYLANLIESINCNMKSMENPTAKPGSGSKT